METEKERKSHTINSLDKIAHNYYHPPKKILGWRVELNGKVIFENNSIKICQKFKKDNGFKTAIIKSIR